MQSLTRVITFKFFSSFLVFSFFITSIFHDPVLAQSQSFVQSYQLQISPDPVFEPILFKGIEVDLSNSFHLDFILDAGDQIFDSQAELQSETERLVKYFLAALTIPEQDMWVNLSPQEEHRIFESNFGSTRMGQDLLHQDFLLKQLSASLLHPEHEAGEAFWSRIYENLFIQNGVTDIHQDLLSRVWIVPDQAKVYQSGSKAYILESSLKVLAEDDYKHLEAVDQASRHDLFSDDVSRDSMKSFKEYILPAIEYEINHGKAFARLRQIYNAMIMAVWYKKAVETSMLNDVFVDQNKTQGLSDQDSQVIAKNIFQKYLTAFEAGREGIFREEYDPASRDVKVRRYVVGGAEGLDKASLEIVERMDEENFTADSAHLKASVDFAALRGEPETGQVFFYDSEADQKFKQVAEGKYKSIVNFLKKFLTDDSLRNKAESIDVAIQTGNYDYLNNFVGYVIGFNSDVSGKNYISIYENWPWMGEPQLVMKFSLVNNGTNPTVDSLVKDFQTVAVAIDHMMSVIQVEYPNLINQRIKDEFQTINQAIQRVIILALRSLYDDRELSSPSNSNIKITSVSDQVSEISFLNPDDMSAEPLVRILYHNENQTILKFSFSNAVSPEENQPLISKALRSQTFTGEYKKILDAIDLYLQSFDQKKRSLILQKTQSFLPQVGKITTAKIEVEIPVSELSNYPQLLKFLLKFTKSKSKKYKTLEKHKTYKNSFLLVKNSKNGPPQTITITPGFRNVFNKELLAYDEQQPWIKIEYRKEKSFVISGTFLQNPKYMRQLKSQSKVIEFGINDFVGLKQSDENSDVDLPAMFDEIRRVIEAQTVQRAAGKFMDIDQLEKFSESTFNRSIPRDLFSTIVSLMQNKIDDLDGERVSSIYTNLMTAQQWYLKKINSKKAGEVRNKFQVNDESDIFSVSFYSMGIGTTLLHVFEIYFERDSFGNLQAIGLEVNDRQMFSRDIQNVFREIEILQNPDAYFQRDQKKSNGILNMVVFGVVALMVHSFLVNNISFVQSYEWNNLIIVFLEMIVGFIIFKLIPSIGRQGQNTTDSVGDADEIVVEEVDDLEVKKRKKPNWKIIIPLSLIFVLVLLYFFGQPFIVEKQNSNKITIESVDGSDGGSQDYIEKPYSELEIYFAQQLLNKAQQGDFQSSRLIKLIFGQEAESLTQSEINRLMEATTLGRYGRYHLSGGFSFYATNLLNRNVISTESILFILLNNRSLQTELLGGTLRNNNLSALIQVLKQKNISIADIPNKIVNLSQASSGGNNDIQKIAQANNLNIQDLEKFYANWKTNGLIWKTKRIDGMALMALRYSKVRDYLGISGSVQTIGQVVPSIKKKISQSNKKKYSDKVVDVSREIQKQMDPAMMQHDVGGIDFNRNLLNLDVEGLMIFDDASLQNDFSLNPQNVIGLEPIIAPVVPFVSGFSLGKSDSSSQDDDSHSSLEINCFVCLIRLTRSV